MKKLLFLITILTLSLTAQAQIPAYSAEEIIHYTSSKDTLYIINFWATWCGPCVAELSEFNALKARYADAPVKVLMVSLDFKENYPYKLARFLERKKVMPEVVWLSDTDPNVFIPKIDNSWQGSIPATVIVHPGKQFKQFIEGSVTERQIRKIADKVLAE
ncbi:MAG: TlpA family protein disulfide reductase [Chitinophagales bacterium]